MVKPSSPTKKVQRVENVIDKLEKSLDADLDEEENQAIAESLEDGELDQSDKDADEMENDIDSGKDEL